MKVLVACEYSATVRDAFRARGHDAWSCDLLPTEGDPRWHIQGDVLDAINRGPWDLIILHVPCTALALCGNSTYGYKMPKQNERSLATAWTMKVWDAAVATGASVALENPASVIFPALRGWRSATVQYIQPWQFGHMEQKKTGLALWKLPMLRETENVREAMMELPRHVRERIHFMGPSPDRAKERARFFPGISAAMAEQWGNQ